MARTPKNRDTMRTMIAQGKRPKFRKPKREFKDTRSVNEKFTDLIALGNQRLQNNVVYRGDEAIVDTRRSSAAALTGYLSFEDSVIGFINDEHRISGSPLSKPGAKTFTLKSHLENSSRVIQAGVNVIKIPSDLKPIQTNREPVFIEQEVEFVTIEPAEFTIIELEDDDVAVSDLPVFMAKIDRSNLSDHSLRYEISRRDQKDRKTEQLVSELLTAIALGLGRAVDKEICRSLIAAGLSDFSLAAAVNSGKNHSELFGFISSNTIAGPDRLRYDAGQLILDNVPAEYCKETEETLIAAWSRFAIAIPDGVDLSIERTDASGKLVITVWFHIQALIPNESFAWKV